MIDLLLLVDESPAMLEPPLVDRATRMLKHFIVTRLGLCVYTEHWFESMIDLFEAVTLPSLARQSSTEFIWLIVIDADIPPKARDRLERLLSSYPDFHLVPIDVTQLLHVRQGCFDWVWDHCQDFILGCGLLDDPYDYIVTSLIDADDAWHQDVISTINRFMAERLPHARIGEESRGTWLRHTSGIAATLPCGYAWFVEADALAQLQFPFMSMAVFVAARFSSAISACSSRHRSWPSYCEVLAFEVSEVEPDRPMWIYVRHHLTTQPWDAGTAVPREPSSRDLLCQDFGIDPQRVQKWREKHDQRVGSDDSLTLHQGRDASAQYDRVFKITALNRQIKALKRRRVRLGETPVRRGASLEDMIARCEARRALLIETLRAHR
ncbi:glycosyltransferase [Bradyrhizobium sp.]